MKPTEFFFRNPVFRFDEFRAAYLSEGRRSSQTMASVLKHHVATGRLLHVRRGLYVTVPHGAEASRFQVDRYLLASRLAEDAVIAYHSALEFLGKAHSVSSQVTYLTRQRLKPFVFQGIHYAPVLAPAAVRDVPDLGGGIVTELRRSVPVRVTGYERTLVDVMDAPQHGGGWEECWRSLEAIEFVDLDAVVDYAIKLGSALTAARVGFYLERHRDPLLVEDRHLQRLQTHAPTRPTYFDRRQRKGGKLVRRWNLIVPESILETTWSEVA